MIEIQHLMEVAAWVGGLTRRANWTLRSRAVVTWEFDSLQAFAGARAQVEAALIKDPMFIVRDGGVLGRTPDEYTWEVDCRDITLRLTCQQVMEVQDAGGRRRRLTARDIR